MANVIINDTHLSNIADAIRNKKGVSTTYLPSEMADAISSISTSGGGGETTVDVKMSYGTLGSTSSNNSYKNQITFGNDINLKDGSHWKMLFYMTGTTKGWWRYDFTTKECIKVSTSQNIKYNGDPFTISSSVDGSVFTDTFEGGIIMNLASSTNYCYVSTWDVNSTTQFSSDSNCLPLLWRE